MSGAVGDGGDLAEEDGVPAVGLVPVEGRGSMPFALLHGESLVAVASWALGEAGVELLDFTVPWSAVRERQVAVVVHDPLCPGAPVDLVQQAVAAATGEAVVVATRPVTDTVREVDGDGGLGEPVDRSRLRAVVSPVVLPAAVVNRLEELPSTDDLADLVAVLAEHFGVTFLAAPATARRVVDESDVRALEALLDRDSP